MLLETYFVVLAISIVLALDSKIDGGIEVSITDYPYQASLIRIGIDVCGATIIGFNRFLTAGHCAKDHDDYSFRYASDIATSGGKLINVTKLIRHPNYDPQTSDYDVAVGILAEDIQLTNASEIIPLSRKVQSGRRTCWASGWGLTENNTRPRYLRAVDVQEYSQEECKEALSKYYISPNMICFGGRNESKDACNGDSGGPLVDRELYELVGISSWGIGCAVDGVPGVYVRIAALYDWIVVQ